MVYTKNNDRYSNIKAFTLVELIVVIVILAILATIAFLSFGSQSSGARDSKRLSDIASISKGVSVIFAKKAQLPLPDSYVTINAGTGFTVYQGIAGSSVLSAIKLEDTKDKLDDKYYTYAVDSTKSKYTVGTYLENSDTAYIMPIADTASAADYTARTLKLKGDDVGIITESGSTGYAPIEQARAGQTINLADSTLELKLNLSSNQVIEGTGNLLTTIQTAQNGNYSFAAPSNCEQGFISVPGNKDLRQPGFCISKYKMRNSSTAGQTQNGNKTWPYLTSIKLVSAPTPEPTTSIKQSEAIIACKNFGAGYHLTTNLEWMTIARNAELIPSNWSSGKVGDGFVYNGNVNYPISPLVLPSSADDKDGNYSLSGSFGETTLDGSRRTLTLSNGSVIWDLAGNVAEHVNKANTIDGSNFNVGKTSLGEGLTGDQSTYDALSMSKYGSINQSYGKTYGMGVVIGAAGVDGDVFVRGGLYYHGERAGIFNLYLENADSSRTQNIGFRCVK